MKALRILSLGTLCMAFASLSFAQSKTETFRVAGNCGMCKSKIEKAAKDAGAQSATWNKDTKELTVTYTSSNTNTAKIQQMIAGAGYDNVGFTATTEAYDKLHSCCKYDRNSVAKTIGSGQCDMAGHKDGKCDMSKCKDKGCTDPATCKDKGCCGGDEKMDCCKDGKCTKEGHEGADCCKKS